MSRAFVKEDAEAFEELPDRRISPHPNHVTQQGLTHLEAMLNGAQGLMPPRWLRKTGPPSLMHPVKCVTGAPAVPALA